MSPRVATGGRIFIWGCRSRSLAGSAGAGLPALQLGVPRLVPDEQPLPPAARIPRGQPGHRHAPTQRGLYPAFQPRARPGGARIPGPLQNHPGGARSYLLELARYVVLNPRRAKMVKRLDAWPWSSYLATCGHSAASGWLPPTGYWRNLASSVRPQFASTYSSSTKAPTCPACGRDCKAKSTWARKPS